MEVSFTPASNPLEILLTHDRWATDQILSACSALTEEQFHRRFDIGPGSLHDTITHIVAAMQVLGDLLAGRSRGRVWKGRRRSLPSLDLFLIACPATSPCPPNRFPLIPRSPASARGKVTPYARGGADPRCHPCDASPGPVSQHAPAARSQSAAQKQRDGMGSRRRAQPLTIFAASVYTASHPMRRRRRFLSRFVYTIVSHPKRHCSSRCC